MLSEQSESVPAIWIPHAGRVYTLDTAARYAGVNRRVLLRYCVWQVIKPIYLPPHGIMAFHEEDLRIVRLGERLRSELGINPIGVRIILRLIRTIEALSSERKFNFI